MQLGLSFGGLFTHVLPGKSTLSSKAMGVA